MDYFELFGLPETIRINKDKLRERYFALSRESHPDYFAKEDQEGQQKALDASAEINKAYRILSDEDETIKYLLAMKGMLEDEERTSLPQDFLMEMLEINEEVAEADLSDENARNQLTKKLSSLKDEIYEPVQSIVEADRGDFSEEEMLRLKDYYLKKKYLKRLEWQLRR